MMWYALKEAAQQKISNLLPLRQEVAVQEPMVKQLTIISSLIFLVII